MQSSGLCGLSIDLYELAIVRKRERKDCFAQDSVPYAESLVAG